MGTTDFKQGLLNILPQTGHSPVRKNYQAHNVSGAKVEEPQDDRIVEDLFKKKCLVTSEHRLKYSILLAVNEMQIKVFFYY